PKRLRFKPVSPTRIHNVELNYDATRIICPAQELALDRAEVAELKDRAATPQLTAADTMARQRDLAEAIDRLGRGLTGQGDLAGALAQFQDSLKLRLAIARTDDENKLWQRDLSTTLLRLGLVRAGLKQNAEALGTFRSGLAIRQNLYAANPTDANARRDLAVAHEHVGDLLNLIGNSRDEALKELRLALKLRSELTMADPNSAQLSTELIVTLYKVSALSDAATAKDLLGKAFALAQIMERQGSLTPEYA